MVEGWVGGGVTADVSKCVVFIGFFGFFVSFFLFFVVLFGFFQVFFFFLMIRRLPGATRGPSPPLFHSLGELP